LKPRPVAILDPNFEGFGVFHTVQVYSLIKPAAPVALYPKGTTSVPALKDTGLVAHFGHQWRGTLPLDL
jgi:hypothetical protein